MRICFLIFLSLAFSKCFAEDFIYKEHTDNDVYSINVKGEDVFVNFGNDEISKATSCMSSDYPVCFFSRRLSLILPKVMSDKSRWCVEEHCFSSARLIESPLNGYPHQVVYKIISPASATLFGRQTGKCTFWYYVEKVGIVAFQHSNESKIYELMGSRGIGYRGI